MNELREKCGLFGICQSEPGPVASDTYYGLYALQHRGQESCGIVVNDDGLFRFHKEAGLVSSVFTPQILKELGEGTMAIGHTRYGSKETRDNLNAQPIVVNHIKGHMAIGHNGALVNAGELRRELELEGSIFHRNCDTEVIAYVIIRERLKASSIEEAINRAMNRLEGAYSLVILSPGKLIAVRDPHGFRPLCYGKRPEGGYVVASESCALDAIGAEFVRDIEPGEIVIFRPNGEIRSIRDHCGICERASCIFEHIYFARPDSCIDGTSVHEARVRSGCFLAQDYPVDADVVIGVPDSGLDAAIGYSQQSGIPFELGFLKNKYIGRTFIAPGQSARERLVRIKLNPIASAVKGKRVVLVDDSIVRGTTSARIVRLMREAGATQIHMRISSPPFTNPCYYGTDIDSRDVLIACHHSEEEICRLIGADSLGYLKTERLGELIDAPCGKGYCDACFTANYKTAAPTSTGKTRYEKRLSEKEKSV